MKKFCFMLIMCICMIYGLNGCSNQTELEENNQTDIMAGTSWLSQNDNSHWVLEKIRPFAGIRQKGKRMTIISPVLMNFISGRMQSII